MLYKLNSYVTFFSNNNFKCLTCYISFVYVRLCVYVQAHFYYQCFIRNSLKKD